MAISDAGRSPGVAPRASDGRDRRFRRARPLLRMSSETELGALETHGIQYDVGSRVPYCGTVSFFDPFSLRGKFSRAAGRTTGMRPQVRVYMSL